MSGSLAASAPSASDGLRVSLAGSLADFAPLLAIGTSVAGLTVSGGIELQALATGSFAALDLTGTLSVADASLAAEGLPPVTHVAIDGAYAQGALDLRTVRAEWQGARLDASARLPLALVGAERLPEALRPAAASAALPARAQIRIESVTPSVLAPFLDRSTVEQIGGRVDVTATAEADSLDPAGVMADLTLDRAELTLAEVPIAQTAPTRLRLAGGRLDVLQWTWVGAGTRLDVTGNVSLAGATSALNLGATGSLDLRMIGAFAPDMAASGQAVFDLKATGPLDHPALTGQASIPAGTFALRDPRLALTDVHAAATFSTDRVDLRSFTASANGGTVQASGSLEYRDLALTGGSLSVQAHGLALEVPEHLRTEIDADLRVGAQRGQPTLTGQVTILRGAYREPVSLAEQLLGGSSSLLPAAGESEAGPFDNLQLGITLVTADDILVENNYGRLDIGADLRLVGTVGAPGMAGRLTVREGGEVYLGGRTYEVQRGTLDFTNPTRIEPILDLSLQTRVQDYDITLEVTGTPETLEVSLRSPGQSQEDIVSLLLTGQLASDSAVAPTEVARGQLLMLLSGEFLGFAGRAVGLDSVQVSRGLGAAASDFDLLSTQTDPSARLTIAKHLSRQAQLIVSQSLKESGDITWIVSYRPAHDVELRATTNDDNSRAYEFRHELVFGASPGTAREEASSRTAPRARVAGVRFAGPSRVPIDELRDLLGLTAGDRFDFYRWQQDQDRLTEWLHAHDFLEARLTARREEASGPGGDGRVTLEYAIDPGPHTTLTVVGYALPGDVVARMNAAWAQSVFDGFLLDDLQSTAREALVGDGYLLGRVRAAVAPTGPDEKEILVEIEPGRRFDARRLVFSGNADIDDADLMDVVATADLGATAWIDPGAVKSALERFYRARGYLAAVVTPEPPVFGDREATLPIRIDEGEQFRIGEIRVRGVEALSEEAARAETGLAVGDPYVPAAVEPARRKLESEYLLGAYNQVRVSAATDIDRDHARVDVTLTVDEGPKQVVSAVEVRGGDVTSRGVIDRALDLAPGDPADLNQVYRAQKRLYDTGVFQSADVALEPARSGDASDGVQPVRAVVTLQELARYRFRYGFRLSDEVAPVEPTRQVRPAFVADLLRRNLFGRAMSAGVAGQIESDRRLARSYFSLPTLFGRPVVTNVFATVSREFFPPASEFDLAIVERRNEFTLEQRFRPARAMAVTYGYSFGHTHAFEPPDPVQVLPPVDISSSDIARLTGAYAWDTRDDPSNAHRGWFHSSGLEFGSKALGSDLRFIKYPRTAVLLPNGRGERRAGVGSPARPRKGLRRAGPRPEVPRGRRHDRTRLRREQSGSVRYLRAAGGERAAGLEPGSALSGVPVAARRQLPRRRQRVHARPRSVAGRPRSRHGRRVARRLTIRPVPCRLRHSSDAAAAGAVGPLVLRDRAHLLSGRGRSSLPLEPDRDPSRRDAVEPETERDVDGVRAHLDAVRSFVRAGEAASRDAAPQRRRVQHEIGAPQPDVHGVGRLRGDRESRRHVGELHGNRADADGVAGHEERQAPDEGGDGERGERELEVRRPVPASGRRARGHSRERVERRGQAGFVFQRSHPIAPEQRHLATFL